MEGYLGETKISVGPAKAEDYIDSGWIPFWIEENGGFDGEHHKQWLIDQCLRISLGTPVEVYVARWDNGHEETRYRLGEPSAEYLAWVAKQDEWDKGLTP